MCSVGNSSALYFTADWALMFLTRLDSCVTLDEAYVALQLAQELVIVLDFVRSASETPHATHLPPSRRFSSPPIAIAMHRHSTPLPPTLPPSTLPNPAHITEAGAQAAS